MKGIVVYKGKYGATQQYAQWLGEELNLPVATSAGMQEERLEDYDFVVIGTSVYIGKLQISQWLKDNLSSLKSKKLFLFLVAGTPPDQKEKLLSYVRLGVPEEIRDQCEMHFLPGKLILKKLSWTDRFMLNMGARLSKDPTTKQAMLTDYNNVKKENIASLVKSVKKHCVTAAEELVQPV